MSRWLGLHEDQRVGEVLATRICQLFPSDPVWCHREQARSHIGTQLRTDGVNNTNPLWERAGLR